LIKAHILYHNSRRKSVSVLQFTQEIWIVCCNMHYNK